MAQLDKLAQIITRRKAKKLSELNSGILAIIGSGSFLIAGYWGLMLSTVVPDMVKATNEHGLPPLAIGIWLLLGGYSAIVWYFGCIASRCHSLLYERWFK
ncbi:MULTISPECIES: hypothetical protein [Gammaproteobacteria]|uniref:hypothetical protein n=1 Tax=Gammaproteobacteria TaxID=1236 RepID=UPI000DCFC88F|nr:MULTISPECIES: hypothetical protein [Gammaproteobacteria]RTE86366.1 hypothetical protein DQX04_07320 [Aliidiomarina sp. B3213]TCZ91715.1 hypothetical protein EYQ95_07325 [Lysobacter sp. N42]